MKTSEENLKTSLAKKSTRKVVENSYKNNKTATSVQISK